MIFFAQVAGSTPPVEHAFWGQWIVVAIGIIGGLGGLASLATFFATRRELIALEQRVTRVESEAKEDRHNFEVHASARSKTLFDKIEGTRDKLEGRLNPLVENTAALKASQEAFTTAFTNFTNVMQELIRTNRNKES